MPSRLSPAAPAPANAAASVLSGDGDGEPTGVFGGGGGEQRKRRALQRREREGLRVELGEVGAAGAPVGAAAGTPISAAPVAATAAPVGANAAPVGGAAGDVLLCVRCCDRPGFLCSDSSAAFCCSAAWLCSRCSCVMAPVMAPAGGLWFWFSFCFSTWLWASDCASDWLSIGFWLNRLASRCLFSCSILRARSSASRCSSACCSRSFRRRFTSSSICRSSSRTRATQFSGILMPGGGGGGGGGGGNILRTICRMLELVSSDTTSDTRFHTRSSAPHSMWY
ncbi:hypothetical protein EYF80_048218 [Liparis tanakae]|uniref:Uncharacterized protein n=1 Tax=Liparis tanakae TaxID=230148 RepID=A0A4Z2FLH5_9TELE|nr:hypothetical protein EYF80_048218 [Liparis tanakae]